MTATLHPWSRHCLSAVLSNTPNLCTAPGLLKRRTFAPTAACWQKWVHVALAAATFLAPFLYAGCMAPLPVVQADWRGLCAHVCLAQAQVAAGLTTPRELALPAS